MTCLFPDKSKGTGCTNCGYVLKRDYREAPTRTCRNPSKVIRPKKAKPQRTTLDQASQVLRLAICHTCGHCPDPDPERGLESKSHCNEIIRRGKAKGVKRAGKLMHPLGIPNPNAKCPLGKW